ncbi:helix-turn-helix domain-containing protein [Rothia halotolerans]|uniref:helix-turn-helix domain-containing protein n=1 Tax=Rothia halotolerans TaxID=405770 RepID=UPI0013EE3581|nr:helix-turn-helix domain-containing protein [Rothia halotolerans]
MPADRPIADVVLHPVRMKIIQQLGGRSMTTAQLRQALPEVKQATLYRHVSALLEAELLTVVEERQVRGAVERTLALGERMAHVDQEELRAMDEVQLRSAFTTFLSGLSNDFERFLEEGNLEARDFLGFTRAPVYLDEQDIAALQAEFNEMLAPYLQERRAGQRRISLATVLIPEADS